MNYVQNKIERLQNGEIIVSREPGNSMEPILKSREPVILVPIKDEEELYSLLFSPRFMEIVILIKYMQSTERRESR